MTKQSLITALIAIVALWLTGCATSSSKDAASVRDLIGAGIGIWQQYHPVEKNPVTTDK